MYYIVFDLEWNMAGYRNKVRPDIREQMPFEIIEIGAVKLDSDLQYVDRFSIQIKPVVYKILDKHVAAVTNRYQETLNEGVGFKDGIEAFFHWASEKPEHAGEYPNPMPKMPEDVIAQAGHTDYLFATWSDSDTQPLRDNLGFHGMNPDLPARCLDVQKLFAKVANEGTSQQRSLTYALEHLAIEHDDDLHLALNDALYTSRILQALVEDLRAKQSLEDGEPLPDWMQGLKRMPKLSTTDWLWSYSYDPNLTYQERILLDSVPDKDQMLEGIENLEPHCPHCREPLYSLIEWKTVKTTKFNQTFTRRYECPTHGRVAGQLKIRRDKNNIWHGSVVYRIERPYEL